MTPTPLALRFQIGARTLMAIERHLVRMPWSLDDVLADRLPSLPPLSPLADGYLLTSLPAHHLATLTSARGGMISFVRQRYQRYYADLSGSFDAYLENLSINARSSLKRKARKVARASAGVIDVHRFRTPEEVMAFHAIARRISVRTYQERLLGAGLPEDPSFVAAMKKQAEAGGLRAWLLNIAGQPAAYLYCSVIDGTVRYDHVGYDPDYAALSPGAVLHLEAMRDLFEEGGFARFDFTEGEGQHKRQLATASVACLDLLLLRASLPNRFATIALGGFDIATTFSKRALDAMGHGQMSRKLRRA